MLYNKIYLKHWSASFKIKTNYLHISVTQELLIQGCSKGLCKKNGFMLFLLQLYFLRPLFHPGVLL